MVVDYLASHDPDMADFTDVDVRISQLRQQISATEDQLADLHRELSQAEARARASRDLEIAYQGGLPLAWQQETLDVFAHVYPGKFDRAPQQEKLSPLFRDWPLHADEYRRYGRQLIMPEVGLRGQVALRSARVLVIGVGGLGCPAAAYLVGAGIGTVGLVDGDTVEKSNLHRQIIHSTSRVGQTKVASAVNFLEDLNPHVSLVPHEGYLEQSTAVQLLSQYDLVLDCTDHPGSRYLISDTCVLAQRPLVSASALRMDGQLITLNNPPAPQGSVAGGPCYRCIWPIPPPPEAVTTCGEGGILGPVVGAMGVLQALEAIKLLVGAASQAISSDPPRPTMLMFSGASPSPFRCARMRGRRPECAACGIAPEVTLDSLQDGRTDYAAFCGTSSRADALPDSSRMAPAELAQRLVAATTGSVATPRMPVILDVRPATEFGICSLEGAVNLPWANLPGLVAAATLPTPHTSGDAERSEQVATLRAVIDGSATGAGSVVVVCRLGNDSQLAVRLLGHSGLLGSGTSVVDLHGGLAAWRRDVDPSWPDY